jgi:hypothetical protein
LFAGSVLVGLVPTIHVLASSIERGEDVDARHKGEHDGAALTSCESAAAGCDLRLPAGKRHEGAGHALVHAEDDHDIGEVEFLLAARADLALDAAARAQKSFMRFDEWLAESLAPKLRQRLAPSRVRWRARAGGGASSWLGSSVALGVAALVIRRSRQCQGDSCRFRRNPLPNGA